MKYAYTALAFAAAVTAQGEPKPLYPQGVNSPPTTGTNFPNNSFVLGTQPTSDDRETGGAYNCNIEQYATAPRISLTGSVLTDQNGWTGSIVANDQFQFDGPPQAGVKVSAGWVRQSNGRLSLNGNDKFYNCLSGDFSNIYSATQGEQCKQVYLLLQLCTYCSKGNVTYTAVKKEFTPQFEIPKVSNNDNLADDERNLGVKVGSTVGGSYSKYADCNSGSSTASLPAPTASSAASGAASASKPATTAAAAPSMPAPPMVMLPPQTQSAAPVATAAAAPAPVAAAPAAGNGTAAAGTGAAKPPTSSSSPVPFTNAAPAVAVGQKAGAFLAVVAAAFALA